MGPDETAEMALRCRESALTIETCVDRYLDLYAQVIRDRYLYPPEQARNLYYRRPRPRRIRCWYPRRF
jgi:hypothetical protein